MAMLMTATRSPSRPARAPRVMGVLRSTEARSMLTRLNDLPAAAPPRARGAPPVPPAPHTEEPQQEGGQQQIGDAQVAGPADLARGADFVLDGQAAHPLVLCSAPFPVRARWKAR